MVRQIDAVFSQGAFRPIEPLSMPEGTRVHLSVEENVDDLAQPRAAVIRTPRLARREDVADFVMQVEEKRDAGI